MMQTTQSCSAMLLLLLLLYPGVVAQSTASTPSVFPAWGTLKYNTISPQSVHKHLNCTWNITCANTRPALIISPPALRMVNGFILPAGAFLYSVGAVSWFRQKTADSPLFSVRWMCCYSLCSGGGVATTISMRVVDKAFQLRQQWAI